MDVVSLAPDRLLALIDRVRKVDGEGHEALLHTLIQNALSELFEFVPSEGGLMLIDDPGRKPDQRNSAELIYVAAFGKGTAQLPGKRIPAASGVVGETYLLGKQTVRKAEKNQPIVLDKLGFPFAAESVICMPLKIESSVVGVLALYNKKDPFGFTIRDLKLVEIFAGYLSTSLQNAVDTRKSRELSKRDDLTGLSNDRHFHRQLEADVRRADSQRSPLSLIFMDLDNFKSVNDQFGHLVGSQTLKEVGFVLRECVPFDQACLARYGGDEYVIILPSLTLEAALDVGERIRSTIATKLFMIDQGEQDGSFINIKGVITCSVGVSSLVDHVPTTGTIRDRKNLLIRLADQAMYRAKENGKNCVCAAESAKPTD